MRVKINCLNRYTIYADGKKVLSYLNQGVIYGPRRTEIFVDGGVANWFHVIPPTIPSDYIVLHWITDIQNNSSADIRATPAFYRNGGDLALRPNGVIVISDDTQTFSICLGAIVIPKNIVTY